MQNNALFQIKSLYYIVHVCSAILVFIINLSIIKLFYVTPKDLVQSSLHRMFKKSEKF